jgi:hypothetical protein
LRTVRTNELANKEPRERLVAGGRINEPRGGIGEDGNADNAGCTALLFLIGLRSVLDAIAGRRLGVRLRAAFRFLDLRSSSLQREDRKQQRRTKDGADYEMQNRSHGIHLSLATKGFNPRPSGSRHAPMNSAAYFVAPLLDLGPDVVANSSNLFEALGLGPGHP